MSKDKRPVEKIAKEQMIDLVKQAADKVYFFNYSSNDTIILEFKNSLNVGRHNEIGQKICQTLKAKVIILEDCGLQSVGIAHPEEEDQENDNTTDVPLIGGKKA